MSRLCSSVTGKGENIFSVFSNLYRPLTFIVPWLLLLSQAIMAVRVFLYSLALIMICLLFYSTLRTYVNVSNLPESFRIISLDQNPLIGNLSSIYCLHLCHYVKQHIHRHFALGHECLCGGIILTTIFIHLEY